MHEDFDTRLWANHGQDFARDMMALAAKTMVVFERLAAFNFAAPWRKIARDSAAQPNCPSC